MSEEKKQEMEGQEGIKKLGEEGLRITTVLKTKKGEFGCISFLTFYFLP